MKNILLLLILIFVTSNVNAQFCSEVMGSVKSNYRTTYNSYNSDAISRVTLYDVTIYFNSYCFVIVCFK